MSEKRRLDHQVGILYGFGLTDDEARHAQRAAAGFKLHNSQYLCAMLWAEKILDERGCETLRVKIEEELLCRRNLGEPIQFRKELLDWSDCRIAV